MSSPTPRPAPQHPWTEAAVEVHLREPSTFYTNQASALAEVDASIDARMAEIYQSLPGERLSFSLSLAGTLAGSVWLAVAGTLWAIAPGMITIGIIVVWVTAGTRRRPAPPPPAPSPRPE
ncbi:hypothetical protein SHL15_0046 [Streptomyces hygroscopicus subsp. limoneus]|nr:hypothetical protein SHL15_0046 [Streptomyces hygroscopicus subsp. limoneus]